jgi:hypothetical protein
VADSKRQCHNRLRAQLLNERSSFESHWRELADYIYPRRPRFFTSDVNRGDRRSQKILDSTAGLAARTLRSGMMSGVTSPARPWFRLTTPDPDLAEFGAVKEWLHIVTQRMTTVYLRSNIYNVLPIVYGDLGVFGTSPLLVDEDFEETLRGYPFPVGSYCLANDARLKVKVFTRDFRLTVRQIVQMFGQKKDSGSVDWTNISSYVKNLWDQGQTEAWVDLCHVIKPNDDYDATRLHSKFKKFSSSYFELGSGSASSSNYLRSPEGDVFLRESGYDYFPVLAPRWEITGEDVYGTTCPGMEALPDIKQLQLGEKRSLQAIEKMVNPPMVGPTHLRNQKTSILPGDITYSDEREGQRGFRPAHEVNFRIQELEMKQEQVRTRIKRSFFEDLFLMLANSDRREITAREIDERHEEKLLALGPVLEQLNQDLLDPLIDVTFDIMVKRDQIPPAPEELHGVPLKVEYLSVMAQAQKLIGISGVERFTGFLGQTAQATQNPALLDKLDGDQLVDVVGDMYSVPPGIIRTDDKVQAIRQQRAQAQQQQAQAQMIQQGASAAKDLSQSDLEGDNALNRLLDQANAGRIV